MSRQKTTVRLLLSEVQVDERRFQDRVLAGNGPRHREKRKKQCESHIEEMAATVKLTNEQLDPFFVWKDAGGWNLVNGFHRYYAYKTAEWRPNRKLKCFVVEASSDEEALQKVFPDNVKASLGMPTGERMEVCWKARLRHYQQARKMPVRETALTYCISKNSVSNMDKVIKKLIAANPKALERYVGTWDYNRRAFMDYDDEMDIDMAVDAASVTRLANALSELTSRVPWDIAQKAVIRHTELLNEQSDNRGKLVIAGADDWELAKEEQERRAEIRRARKVEQLTDEDDTVSDDF